MDRQWITQYSHHLNRDMHILVHGQGGVPFMAFPCQNSMCTNYEEFGMIDTIAIIWIREKSSFSRWIR